MGLEEVRAALSECVGPKEVFDHIWGLDINKRDTSLILLREWWSARNKANAGETMRNVDNICHTIRMHQHDFSKTEKKPEQVTAHAPAMWKRAPLDVVKVNFDASYYVNTGRGAWGCIACNDQGEFLAAKAGSLQHLTGPLHAEVVACVLATEASSEMGLHKIILESDSHVLVHALNSDEYDRKMIGVLQRETRSVCYANFESFTFSFCNRKCNKVAHELPAFGFRMGAVDLSWIEQAPDFVSGLVASDMAEPV
ncbi:hypothetical protein D1007_51441 [Hordeum vulgare]|nr:hypothetical protein D1007_51441 [Hordeum vulgare]